MTPELYYPCRNCGDWRRNHVGEERKCLFGPATFEPIDITLSSHSARERIVERLDRLEARFQRLENAFEKKRAELDKVLMSVHYQCSHIDENGESMIEALGHVNVGMPPKPMRHAECRFCKQDWYEDEEV